MLSPSKRKRHDAQSNEISSPLPSFVMDLDTPRLFDFNLSMENTPVFPITMNIPTSKDWTPNMQNPDVPDRIFSDTPYLGREAAAGVGPGSGVAGLRTGWNIPRPRGEGGAGVGSGVIGIGELGGSDSNMGVDTEVERGGSIGGEGTRLALPTLDNFDDFESNPHFLRNHEALTSKLDDITRSTSNYSRYSTPPSQSDSLLLASSHNLTSSQESPPSDPFAEVGVRGLVGKRGKKRSGLGLGDEGMNIVTSEGGEGDGPPSQMSEISGLLAITAAAESLPSPPSPPTPHPTPLQASHSPTKRRALAGRGDGSKARGLGGSREGSVSGLRGSGDSSTSMGMGEGVMGKPSLFAHLKTNLETPVSGSLNSKMFGLDISKSSSKSVVCNCKKSRCLKMYCDCFRLQAYCQPGCNCQDCANTAQCEETRQLAMRHITDRNPEAFKPRVIEDTSSNTKGHLTGCHCKKSACLKKYCECYTATVFCTEKCRCIDCQNTEKHRKKDGVASRSAATLNPSYPPPNAHLPLPQPRALVTSSSSSQLQTAAYPAPQAPSTPPRHPKKKLLHVGSAGNGSVLGVRKGSEGSDGSGMGLAESRESKEERLTLDMSTLLPTPHTPPHSSSFSQDTALLSPSKLLELASVCEERCDIENIATEED